MAYKDFTPVGQRLKLAWHEATMLQGVNTPAAKHLMDAIERELRNMKKNV